MICTDHQILFGLSPQERDGQGVQHLLETGEVCTGFWWEDLRERDYLEDLSVDGNTMLTWIIKKWDAGMDWIDLTQDRHRWRAFVNAVMKLS